MTGENMSETRTASMLQRVPVILAVTAASYGLKLQPAGERTRAAAPRHGNGRPQGTGAHRRRAQAIG
jgi:hypothetical protein